MYQCVVPISQHGWYEVWIILDSPLITALKAGFILTGPRLTKLKIVYSL